MGKAAHAAGIGIGTLDQRGFFAEVNPALCLLLGYPSEELTQRPLTSLCAAEQRPECHDLFQHLAIGLCECFDLEMQALQSGEFPIWVYLTVSAIPESEHFVVTMHDTSDYFDLLSALEDRSSSESDPAAP